MIEDAKSKSMNGQNTKSHAFFRLLLYYAHVRPCTPMYAQYAHKLHPVRPVRPWAYMGVHCTPIKNLYAHIIVRPWAYMGVHVRPQKKFQQFFVGVQCTPMYAHVRPQEILYGHTMYAHKKIRTPTKMVIV